MGRVLCIYEKKIATVSVMEHVFEELFSKQPVQKVFKRNSDVTAADFQSADCVLLIRPHNYLSWKLTQRAVKSGCWIIFYMDDDMFALPKSKPVMPCRIRALRKCLGAADLILSSSPYLVKKYAKYTKQKRGVVADTAVSATELSTIPGCDLHEGVRLVYAAGVGHESLFEYYIAPILKSLDQLYGTSISLDFVGLRPNIEPQDYSFPIRFYAGMELSEYRQFMKEQHYDIGLAPLHDDPFSRCKYFNKYLEYTLVGTTGIYSNVKPYTYAVKSGENGLLAENNPKSWLKGITRLIDEPDLRQRCVANAKQHLKEQFSSEKISSQLLEEIPELALKRKKAATVKSLKMEKLIYKGFQVLDILYLTGFYMKREGVGSVFQKLKEQMERISLKG